jgi:hypothetical protein
MLMCVNVATVWTAMLDKFVYTFLTRAGRPLSVNGIVYATHELCMNISYLDRNLERFN